MEGENAMNKKLEQIYIDLQKDHDYPSISIDMNLDIPFINESDNEDPRYESKGASGMDLRANLEDEPIVLQPLERRIIPTGLFFALPEGYELQVRPRSGLAHKHGITVLNSPGTIDADYRGEVGVLLINLGNKPFTIEHGDRIAQGVIAVSLGDNFYKPKRVEKFDDTTDRGTGGFGSTGVK